MKTEAIVEAIHSVTAEVFSTMMGVEVQPLDIKQESTIPVMIDGVSAVVGIAGTWVGNGVICCSASLACRICELFLMTEATSVNDEVLDAVAELANMIIGNFKTSAEAVVGPLGLSVPTVIYGQNFTSKSLGTSNWLVMPFRCEGERFEVRVWFAPAEANSYRYNTSQHLQVV